MFLKILKQYQTQRFILVRSFSKLRVASNTSYKVVYVLFKNFLNNVLLVHYIFHIVSTSLQSDDDLNFFCEKPTHSNASFLLKKTKTYYQQLVETSFRIRCFDVDWQFWMIWTASSIVSVAPILETWNKNHG